MTWPMKRLRYLATFNPPVPSSVRTDAEGDYPLLPMDSINEFTETGAPEVRPVGDLLNGYSYLEPTDVAYAKVTPCFENGKGLIGSVLDGPTFATTEITVLRPHNSVNQRFLGYLLQSSAFRHAAIASMTGAGGLKRVSETAMRDLRVPAPPLEEQRLIADYLDRETAEIDAALAEHKHLRALLLERRAETITAATRPSNPELKEAPLVRLRHVTSLNPSPRANISPDSAQLFPLFSMDSISEFGPLRPPVLRPYSELATGYSYLEPTDVAYAKVTPCFENGKGLVGAELDGPSFATTELTVLRPAPEVDQNYLALVLQSADFHAVGEASMTGAGGLKRVSEHAARNYRFHLPDKKTQIRIVEQVRLEADETDVLISDSNRLSDLLLERRAALISAAVTGQIDVASHGVSAAERLQDELEVHV